jgi:hypothetical protein
MIAFLLSVLFVATGLFSVLTIAATCSRYARGALALRAQVAACEPWREVRVRTSEIALRPSATVLRPVFKAAGRPSTAPALPAAA